MGDQIEVLQIAQSARDYLDSLGLYDVKITAMTTEDSQVRKTLGTGMNQVFKQLLQKSRISYISNAKINRFEGDTDIEAVHFNIEENYGDNVDYDKAVDHFLNVDMVICERGVGSPKGNLLSMVGAQAPNSSHAV